MALKDRKSASGFAPKTQHARRTVRVYRRAASKWIGFRGTQTREYVKPAGRKKS